MPFDRHCTSPARLEILVALVRDGELSFTELKRATGLNDGNLHTQAIRLVDAGYLERRKALRGGRELTFFRIGERGIVALRLHVRKLQVALDSHNIPASRPAARKEDDDGSRVW